MARRRGAAGKLTAFLAAILLGCATEQEVEVALGLAGETEIVLP